MQDVGLQGKILESVLKKFFRYRKEDIVCGNLSFLSDLKKKALKFEGVL